MNSEISNRIYVENVMESSVLDRMEGFVTIKTTTY